MLVEVKKVIAIESIPIIVVSDDDTELAVELAMDIPDMVLVAESDMDIVMPDMDMLAILIW